MCSSFGVFNYFLLYTLVVEVFKEVVMSALLSEDYLNDYISPALACTKPTEIKKEKFVTEDGEFQVGVEPQELEKVTISLSDCLACSGCITSSEEIMLSQQSHSVFLDAWRELGFDKCGSAGDAQCTNKLVVSISPHCRASMARYYGVDVDAADYAILRVFKEVFHATSVIGDGAGRLLSVKRVVEELMERRKASQGTALSSICPGFLIYTEKTKPKLVPMLLNVKSAQQVTGALFKEIALEEGYDVDTSLKDGKRTNVQYHLTIVPCFDKKLEASRPDGEGEVNCVITPREVLAMLGEMGVSFRKYLGDWASLDKQLQQSQLGMLRAEMSPAGWDPLLHWSIPANGDGYSDGYAYQYACTVRDAHVASGCAAQVVSVPGKNADVLEYRVVEPNSEGGKVIARACVLSGFRNIQNLCRKLDPSGHKKRSVRRVAALRSRGRKDSSSEDSTGTPSAISNALGGTANPAECDYVEVSACPSGSINGGGLLMELAPEREEMGETPLPSSTIGGNARRRQQQLQELQAMYKAQIRITDETPTSLPPAALPPLPPQYTMQYTFYIQEEDPAKPDIVTVGNTW